MLHAKILLDISDNITQNLYSLLGVSVDGGYDSSSGWGGGLLLCLLSQVLADIGRGVGAFQFRLLLLSFTVGIRLSWLRWFLFDCWWCGGWGLGNSDLRGVQVDTIGWGVVVSVGPRHSVKELAKTYVESDKHA